MLCYRCGSYTPDGTRKCGVCGQAFAKRRSTGKTPVLAAGGAPANVPPFEVDVVVGGRYRVLEAVTHSTAGWLLRARDEEVDVDVALKVLSPNLLQTEDDRGRFLKAVKRARRVHHPNVARIYDEGRDDQYVYYTMPFLEGLSLRKIIDLRSEKGQRFTLREALPLLTQLALGLDALERMGAHGALRPNSVLVLPDVVRITAVPHLSGLPRRPFVVRQAQSGCYEYLSPEARAEDKPFDGRADVYSLSVITAEMLTGQVYGHDSEKWAEALPDLPSPMVAAIQRGLAENPDERFARPSALVEAIVEASGDAEISSSPSTPEPLPMEGSDTSVERAPTSRRMAALEDTEPADDAGPPTAVVSVPSPNRKAKPGPSRPSARRISARSHSRLDKRRSSSVLAAAVAIVLVGLAVSAAMWWRHRTDEIRFEPVEIENYDPVPRPPEPGQPIDADTAPDDGAEPVPALESPPRGQRKPERNRGRDRAAVRERDRGRDRDKHDDEANQGEDDTAALARPPLEPPLPPPSPPLAPGSVGSARAACPPGMVSVSVAEGEFQMGSRAGDSMRGFGDLSSHRVKINEFCIDIYEFPNQRGRMPMTGVSWGRAKNACERRGKRLCTEAEWELACKGKGNSRFVTGARLDTELCNAGRDDGKIATVGAFGRCRSGFGVADLAGNVAEWTAGRWSDDIPDRVVKGGSAVQGVYSARCAARANEVAATKRDDLGFRCCADR